MGAETPVPVNWTDASDPSKSKGYSVQYRQVGTNIDCTAEDLEDGRFKLSLTIENSSAVPPGPSKITDAPVFRTANMSLTPVLRDGQSTLTVSATDPATGEVVKIDVTLNVVK